MIQTTHGKINRSAKAIREAYQQGLIKLTPVGDPRFEEGDDAIKEALDSIDEWRRHHAGVIIRFRNALERLVERNRDIENILISQRLKRMPTIIYKLIRYEDMQLARMQDIAGIRCVFNDLSELEFLVKKYSKPKKNHILKNTKNYIEEPQESGYRAIHLIYQTRFPKQDELSGLMIEIQFRTRLQHLWAMAVETVGILQKMPLKFGGGDQKWRDFFALVSSLFALEEKKPVVLKHQHLSLDGIKSEINKLKYELEVDTVLDGIAKVTAKGRKKSDTFALITLDYINKKVSLEFFSKRQEAHAYEQYKKSESDSLHGRVYQTVLVSVNQIKKLEQAYPSYFLDVREFVKLLNGLLKN